MELSDLEWLCIFSRLGTTGVMQIEPNFRSTLTSYRRAIQEAQQLAPEIDPPQDFIPTHPRRVSTRQTWRYDPRFEELWEAYYRLRWMTIEIAAKVLPQTPDTHLPRAS